MPFSYYRRLNNNQKRIYRRSDQLVRVPLPDVSALTPIVNDLATCLNRDERKQLEHLCNQLVNTINQQLNVPRVLVKVLAKRPSHDWGELHGLYEPEHERRKARISVWMRTAKRTQVVAFRTFLRTLLHELCHHLDYELFGLEDSYHTQGFYQRESDLFHSLTRKQRPPEQYELF